MNSLVTLERVGKVYPKIDTNKGRLIALKDILTRKSYCHGFAALADISFQILRGQSLALVGENGSGKSTLLKLIAGVIKPTSGKIEVRGRVSALLELGAGFHPEYDGIENIRLAGALLGLNPEQIDKKMPQILAFADIGERIRDPLKHYSSGMVVRLGFAVATALEPDILITDEVLAVGDETFQRKCSAWIERYLAMGGTLLLVSHNMYHVQKLCQRAIWLQDGQVRLSGSSGQVAQAYLDFHEQKTKLALNQYQADLRESGKTYSLKWIRAFNFQEIETTSFLMGDGLVLQGNAFSPDGRAPTLAVGIVRTDGVPIYGTFSDLDQFPPSRWDAHHFAFQIKFPELSLLPGHYWLRAHVMDPEGIRLLDSMELSITILGETRELGICRLQHHWEPLTLK